MSSDIPRERTVYRRSTGKPPYHLVKSTESIPSPLPATAVLIRVRAVSLNFRDANILNGTNPWSVIEGGIPCSDAAGDIIATGSNTTRFTIGDKVIPTLDLGLITGEEQTRCWLGGDADGTLATYFLVDEQSCVKFPEHLSYAEATCLPNAGLTAWSSIISEERKLTAGRTVLLQGTGGVSLMAMKLALAAGCRAIITSSSDRKLESVKKMAGDKEILTINYNTTPDWDQEAIRLNGGMGVDIVLENGGTPSLMRSLRATKRRGIVSQVGYLGKQDPADLDGLLPLLIDKTITYRGICVGSRLDLEQMNKVIDATNLRFEDVIDRRFSFDEAEEAIKYLWSAKHVGKIVIDVA
jgi:NADPH:quinone reductase-like Zn-dependent oxidoreductase